MASILDPHIAEIPKLCRHYSVSRLELFGSAPTAAFDPQGSDLDACRRIHYCIKIGEANRLAGSLAWAVEPAIGGAIA